MFVIAEKRIVEIAPELAGPNRLGFTLSFYCGVGHTSNSLHSALQFATEAEALEHKVISDIETHSWVVLQVI